MGRSMIGEHDVRASNTTEASERLALLRQRMMTNQYDAYLLPRSDEYQGEYVPPHAMRLAWLTGFTGSAGACLVTHDKAAVFIDGRYTLQVTQQCEATLYDFVDLELATIGKTLGQQLEANQTVAYDPALWTRQQLETIRDHCPITLTWKTTETSLVSQIWADAPSKPSGEPYAHDLAYAGMSTADKLADVWAQLPETVDLFYVSKPEDLCWLLNVRGNDVPCTPLVLSTLLLHRDGALDWFIDQARITSALQSHLPEQLTIRQPDGLLSVIESLSSPADLTLATDFTQTNEADLQTIESSAVTLVDHTNPIVHLKAIKNPVEQAGARSAHETDGVALVKFLHWLETQALADNADEILLESTLWGFRNQSNHVKDVSFESIVGSGPNGAIVHYRVTPETNRKLQTDDIVLVDSGGQYYAGTTDVTRTVALGEPTDLQKRRFTQVLKGHIQLGSAQFPEGVGGAHLDALARTPLWADGKDYAHGTGHGVGSFLSVHEGPQNISRRSTVPLAAGMICSNEPGYYEKGEYGIRIENLVLVKASKHQGMLAFENLTLAPIQQKLIDPSLLTDDEKTWLNQYHQVVWDKLSPHLPETEKAWLAEAIKPL